MRKIKHIPPNENKIKAILLKSLSNGEVTFSFGKLAPPHKLSISLECENLRDSTGH